MKQKQIEKQMMQRQWSMVRIEKKLESILIQIKIGDLFDIVYLVSISISFSLNMYVEKLLI